MEKQKHNAEAARKRQSAQRNADLGMSNRGRLARNTLRGPRCVRHLPGPEPWESDGSKLMSNSQVLLRFPTAPNREDGRRLPLSVLRASPFHPQQSSAFVCGYQLRPATCLPANCLEMAPSMAVVLASSALPLRSLRFKPRTRTRHCRRISRISLARRADPR
jgi:hypothetical protein